eukprot:13292088-Alexandrium_andersonii.AAC.1
MLELAPAQLSIERSGPMSLKRLAFWLMAKRSLVTQSASRRLCERPGKRSLRMRLIVWETKPPLSVNRGLTSFQRAQKSDCRHTREGASGGLHVLARGRRLALMAGSRPS